MAVLPIELRRSGAEAIVFNTPRHRAPLAVDPSAAPGNTPVDSVTPLIARWRSPIHREMLGPIAIIGCLTLVVKVLGILREVLIARSYGVGDRVDAYLAALTPLTLATGLIGALNAAFIPTFIRVRENHGLERAHDLLQHVAWRGMLVLICATAVLGASGHAILTITAPGFSAAKLALAFRLYLIMLPVLFFTGASTLWTAVLNADARFAVGALAPAALSATVVGALVIFRDDPNAFVLAAATTFGYAFQAVVLLSALRRRDIPATPWARGSSEHMRDVMQQFAPILAGSLLLTSTLFLDQALASLLPAGSVATLGYGNRIATQLSSLLMLAVGSAALPVFSRMVAANDWLNVRRRLIQYSLIVFVMAAVPSVVLFLGSDQLVKLVYQRGAFSAADTRMVAQVQRMFLVQVPFLATSILFVRVISAMRLNQFLLVGNVVTVVMNGLLDYVLMRRMGVAGIALATSVVYIAMFGLLSLAVFHSISRAAATSG